MTFLTFHGNPLLCVIDVLLFKFITTLEAAPHHTLRYVTYMMVGTILK